MQAALGGVRRRRADDRPAADVVDRPLAPLEVPGALPRPPLPGDHVRRARLWPVGSPRRRGGLHPPRVRRRHHRRARRHRRRAGRARRLLLRRAVGECRWPPITPTGSVGLVAIGPAVPLAPMHAERTVHPFDEPIESHRGLGQVQPALLGPRLRGLPDLLRRQVVHRAALDEGDRGLRRLGARDRSGDARRRRPRPRRLRPGEHPVGVRAGASAGARHPRRRGCDPAVRRWGRPRRGDRRLARHGRGWRPRAALPRPGPRQPGAARVHRHTVRRSECRDESARAGARRVRRARRGAGCTGRSSAPASRRSPCCRRGRSPTRATGSSRCPTSPATHRVVTFDGRGCGRSDRPAEPSAYSYLEYRRRHARRARRHRHRSGGASPDSRMGAVWAFRLAADRAATRVAGVRLPRPGASHWRPCQPTASSTRSTSGCRRRTGGRSTTATTGTRAATADLVEFFFDQLLSRAALDQADRGRRRLGAGDRAGEPWSPARRPSLPAGRESLREPSASGSRCPCWSSTATGRAAGPRRLDRRRAPSSPAASSSMIDGGGHLPHGSRPGASSTG